MQQEEQGEQCRQQDRIGQFHLFPQALDIGIQLELQLTQLLADAQFVIDEAAQRRFHFRSHLLVAGVHRLLQGAQVPVGVVEALLQRVELFLGAQPGLAAERFHAGERALRMASRA